MCSVCIFLIYTILSVYFVFHKKNLVLLNQQIYTSLLQRNNFWIATTLWTSVKYFFLYQQVIQCNTDQWSLHITGGINIYLYVCQYISPCMLYVCLSICVISSQSTSKNHVIHAKPSVNLMPCWIKHTARCYLYTLFFIRTILQEQKPWFWQKI